MATFLLIFIASTAVVFAGPMAGLGAIFSSLGSLGTLMSVVGGIASIGSMLGMFGGNDVPSMPQQGYGGPSPTPGPGQELPKLPEVQEVPTTPESENETKKKLDVSAAEDSEKFKREQLKRTTINKTNLTKGMLEDEEASVKKPTLLGG